MTQIGFQTWVKPDLEKTATKVNRSDKLGGRTGVLDKLIHHGTPLFFAEFQANGCFRF